MRHKYGEARHSLLPRLSSTYFKDIYWAASETLNLQKRVLTYCTHGPIDCTRHVGQQHGSKLNMLKGLS